MAMSGINYEFNLADELDRKTVETLQEAQHRYNNGEFSPAQYRAVLWAISGCTRGLGSEMLYLAIDQEESLLPMGDPIVHVFEMESGSTQIIAYRHGQDCFRILQYHHGNKTGRTVIGVGESPIKDACAKFYALSKRLKTVAKSSLTPN